jgi:toxin ParE1/3/4
MTPFKLRAKAKVDLKDIALYTDNRWGREQRNLYLKQFDDTFHAIAETPSIGKACYFIKKIIENFRKAAMLFYIKMVQFKKFKLFEFYIKNGCNLETSYPTFTLARDRYFHMLSGSLFFSQNITRNSALETIIWIFQIKSFG